jgi:pentatricopeptide repeat protein
MQDLGETLDASSETRIQLCGPLFVRIEGRRVESALSNRQLSLLFIYMVLNRHGLPHRDQLTDAVWGDNPPAGADSALSALLSKLRAALGRGVVQGRSELQLILPSDAFVDYEVAVLACHEAESELARAEWARAVWPAKVAYAIASRGFMPGEDLPWVNGFRRHLEEVLIVARECEAMASLQIGGAELSTARRAARDLIQRAPYREVGYRVLMEALAEEGNVAEALRVYEQLRSLLREELGASPGRDLQELHHRLLG